MTGLGFSDARIDDRRLCASGRRARQLVSVRARGEMARWVKVPVPIHLAPGTGRTVELGGRVLALFSDDGALFAIDDACPHQGASLGEGLLIRGRVICPWHQWTFDLRTGENPMAPGCGVASYPVRVRGDAVEIELPDEPVAESAAHPTTTGGQS